MLEIGGINKIVKSKIVATIGPATDSEEKLLQLRERGVDVFRLNMSHASKESKEVEELFHRIRDTTPDVAILCDIQGPKIRIGEINGVVNLTYGDNFALFEDPIVGDETKASISYKGFFKDMSVGNSIFINDGLVRLEVVGKNEKDRRIDTKVIAGGPISSKKGVNIPEGSISMSNPTEKDIKDLKLIAKLNPEYVAASFVANAAEIHKIRTILDNAGGNMVKIIAKIERPIAITNFSEILAASDGIMVARGDLGVEIPAEDVPIRQKEMILKSNQAGKPVIVATQMLESMITNPVPTRAEVNDVFNAVYDRADAVMLSGETSVGHFPSKTVETMDRIIHKAEKYIPYLEPENIDSDEPELYEAVGHAITEMANVFNRVNFRGKIVMFTRGGKSPRLAAKYRPIFPILGISNNVKTCRQLKLVWGVEPIYLPSLNMTEWQAEKIMQHGIAKLVSYGMIGKHEHVICSLPSLINPSRSSIMGLYYVDDIIRDMKIEIQAYNPNWNN